MPAKGRSEAVFLFARTEFTMTSLGAYLRGAWRFAAICSVLLRQGCRYLASRVSPGSAVERAGSVPPSLKLPRRRQSGPDIAKRTLEKLGPTFVKFGQFLSVRPDLIPAAYCAEFRKLQDTVPPFPFAQVEYELRQELKQELSAVFSEFDVVPLAAASIAQVHRARLRTGEEVAVKVQRPGIRESMVSDIMIMLFFAGLLERFVPALRKNEPAMLVREFARWTDRELYFRQEGKNALHFRHNFRDYPGVRFPKVFREHTTRKVLVMERLQGVNVLHAPADACCRRAAAGLIADSMLKQIFIDGFFHGDPHAGNILLLPDRTIAYLDFGIVGYLHEDLRAWIFDILYGMSRRDVSRVISSFLELCNVKDGELDYRGYCRQMHEVLSELPVYEAAGVPFSQVMERFLNTSLEFGIRIPRDFVLVSKAITTFEGTCLSLDPDIQIVEHLRSFVRKHAVKMPDLDEAVKQLMTGPFELARLKRMAVKHGGNLLRFMENPVVRVVQQSAGGGGGETGGGVVAGVLLAGWIVFTAVVSNETAFEKWLKTVLSLPDIPVLALAGLAGIIGTGSAMLLGGRKRKKNGTI